MRLLAGFAFAVLASAAVAAGELPIFDAHVHYSHDAWENVPPKMAIEFLRKAGITHALVSSSNDDGNQKLIAEAPDLILSSLRPYRSRGVDRDAGHSATTAQISDAVVRPRISHRSRTGWPARQRLARPVHRVPRALHRRHRYVHA